MPLHDLVAAARRRPSIDFHAKANKTRTETVAEQTEIKRPVSINAIAQQLRGEQEFVLGKATPESERAWENCKHLQRGKDKNLCRQFGCLCVEDKCPKRYMHC